MMRRYLQYCPLCSRPLRTSGEQTRHACAACTRKATEPQDRKSGAACTDCGEPLRTGQEALTGICDPCARDRTAQFEFPLAP